MTDTPDGHIHRSELKKKLTEADNELDSAVRQGNESHQKYWLGRKELLTELLEKDSTETGDDR